MAEERDESEPQPTPDPRPDDSDNQDPEEEDEERPRRFFGSKDLDPTRVGRDAGQIAEQIVQHFAALENSQVEITIEIRSEIPSGAPEKVVMTVNENCRTWKFKSFGFEEE